MRAFDLTPPGPLVDGAPLIGGTASLALDAAACAALVDGDGELDVEGGVVLLSAEGAAPAGCAFSAFGSDGPLRLTLRNERLYLTLRGHEVGSCPIAAPPYGAELEWRVWYKPRAGRAGLRVRVAGGQTTPDVALPLAGPPLLPFTQAWLLSNLGDAPLHGLGSFVTARHGDDNGFIAEGHVIGDSILAASHGDRVALASRLYTPAEARARPGLTSQAVPGDRVRDQLDAWLASPARGQASLAFVVVQVGINDLVQGRDADGTLADLQALVDAVAADAPRARLVLSQLTPARGCLEWAAPEAYDHWRRVNEAIAGRGPGAIRGVAARVEAHVAAMGDGADHLAGAYDLGDRIHPNAAGRRVNAAAIRAALRGLGLLD